MNARSTTPSLATVAVLAACGGASSQAGSREPAPARSSDVVTMEELGRASSPSGLYQSRLHGAIQVSTSR